MVKLVSTQFNDFHILSRLCSHLIPESCYCAKRDSNPIALVPDPHFCPQVANTTPFYMGMCPLNTSCKWNIQ